MIDAIRREYDGGGMGSAFGKGLSTLLLWLVLLLPWLRGWGGMLILSEPFQKTSLCW